MTDDEKRQFLERMRVGDVHEKLTELYERAKGRS